jgi:hypothetical protein
MAVQARASKELVLLRRRRSSKRVKIRVRSAGVIPYRMAALAEKRYLSDQELAMVAPMNFVTIQTILLYRRMLKGIRPPLFGMTLVTEIVYRIGP